MYLTIGANNAHKRMAPPALAAIVRAGALVLQLDMLRIMLHEPMRRHRVEVGEAPAQTQMYPTIAKMTYTSAWHRQHSLQ